MPVRWSVNQYRLAVGPIGKRDGFFGRDRRSYRLDADHRSESHSRRHKLHLTESLAQSSYRQHVREWLEAHQREAPENLRGVSAGDPAYIQARRVWQRQLATAGLAGVTWPIEVGGPGLGPVEQVIVNQELARANVPGVLDGVGVDMLGPTIIAYGTPEQRTRYLSPLLRGDEIWCQLFSEPAAGSDLAAVQTRARQEGDGSWVINGQKVWTTNAHFASYGMLLARTDPDKPKHKGLTMFIVPIRSDRVTVRGLRQISGESEFNEVFFDDLRVRPDAVLGQVGEGWRVALAVLMYERMSIGVNAGDMGYDEARFARVVAEHVDASRDPLVRSRLGALSIDLMAVRLSGYRALSALERGQIPGPEAGLAKISTVNAAIAAGELVVDLLGLDALQEEQWAHLVSYLPGLRSAGGTEEILRNMIGERVLGLPPEPRVDKDRPFNKLKADELRAAAS